MYDFNTLQEFINNLANSIGIPLSEHNWPSQVNDGKGTYPRLMYFFDEFGVNNDEVSYSTYKTKLTLYRLNTDGEGDTALIPDKAKLWNAIRLDFERLFRDMAALSNNMIIPYTTPQYQPDELGQGNDGLIWINCKVDLRVFTCPDALPGPIPDPLPTPDPNPVQWDDIVGKPTDVSYFNNDAGYQTAEAVEEIVQEAIDALPVIDPADFATAAQGEKADTAIQPEDLEPYVKEEDLPDFNTFATKVEIQTKADLVNGKVPLSQINDALIGNVDFKGLYDGVTITSGSEIGQPLPPASNVNEGWYFISTADYVHDTISYKTGDWIINSGSNWGKVDNTDAVATVAGKTGNVVLVIEDINGLSEVLATIPNPAAFATAAQGAKADTAVQPAALVPLATIAADQRAGVALAFTKDAVYGTSAAPETGNITLNNTGALMGVVVMVLHKAATAPTFGSQFKKVLYTGDYVVNVENYIYFQYISSTNIIYTINQLS